MCEFCEETNVKIVDGYEKGKKYTKINYCPMCGRELVKE